MITKEGGLVMGCFDNFLGNNNCWIIILIAIIICCCCGYMKQLRRKHINTLQSAVKKVSGDGSDRRRMFL